MARKKIEGDVANADPSVVSPSLEMAKRIFENQGPELKNDVRSERIRSALSGQSFTEDEIKAALEHVGLN